jgi:integrase
MAKEKLSARAVETVTAEKETLLSDGSNLYLRIRPENGGKYIKQWFFIYTNDINKRRKLMLGTYPANTLSDARVWAGKLRGMLDKGIDPAEARQAERTSKIDKAKNTCGSLLNAYVGYLKKLGKQSHEDVAGIFKLHLSDKFKNTPAATVTHSDLMEPIRKLVEADKHRTAAKLRSYLRAAFELALNASDDPNAPSSMLGYKLVANPAAGIKVPKGANVPGERTLSRQELYDYANHLEGLPDSNTRDLLKLQLLLAGQRISQLVRATLEGETIVQRDGKGKRETPRKHVLPLQGKARVLVDARGGLFVRLPAANGLDKQPRAQTDVERASQLVRRISKEMGGKPFRLGDIRRTAETMLAALGFASDLRGQLLSHGLGGVQNRHYDKHDYLPEKLKMLQAWEGFLSQKPSKNVVLIKTGS